MKLYQKKKNLELVRENPFKLERDIQRIVEENLETLFDLEFVKSEFAIHNFRLDTLAYDRVNKSLVIIEYKRDKNFSVIDQGYAYLSLLLNNKADFILEYYENKTETIRRNDIEWSQSRVLFLAPEFTSYQKESWRPEFFSRRQGTSGEYK